MCKRPHVKYPLFLSDFSETFIFLTDFIKILKYQIYWKSVQWKPTKRQTDRRDKTNSRFLQFAKAPETDQSEEPVKACCEQR